MSYHVLDVTNRFAIIELVLVSFGLLKYFEMVAVADSRVQVDTSTVYPILVPICPCIAAFIILAFYA